MILKLLDARNYAFAAAFRLRRTREPSAMPPSATALRSARLHGDDAEVLTTGAASA